MKILAVTGTRPEAIKMVPVIQRLRREPERFEVTFCATAQHRQLLDQVLDLFGITPDLDLDLMRPDQPLNELAGRSLATLDRVLLEKTPDWLLVQGDTTTAMCAAMAAFHRGVRVGHVEAGLRTGDLHAPFPEEMNRRVVDLVSDAFFVPTDRAAAAVRAEGTPPGRIHLTGNTVVDALVNIAALDGPVPEEDLVLITVHRRESFGEPLAGIVRAIAELSRRFPATRFVHVVHPNPNVQSVVRRNESLPNVDLLPPQDYRSLIRLMRRCRLILTDSGGIQEEAPTFGKPVLVLREKTERPEGVEAGLARLVGASEEIIVREAARLLGDASARQAMASGNNPYGDGRASERIADALAGRPYERFHPAAARVAVGPPP